MKRTLTLIAALIAPTVATLAACGSKSTASSGSASTGSTSTTTSSSSGGHGGGESSSTSSGSIGSGLGGGVNLGDGGASDANMNVDGCGSMTLKQTLTPGNIIVVFDQSDSMKDEYLADGGAGVANEKWNVAEQALINALTPNQHLVNGGAIFFPSEKSDSSCGVVDGIGTPPQIPIEPGPSFVTDFSNHFSASGWSLILGTPTVDALQLADTALTPAPAKGKSVVVLLTDGAPTCDTKTADLTAPVADMYSRGIQTYAIGLPGSANAANLLNAIAAAGGTGSYLSPGDSSALETALSQIATGTIDQCTITLSPPPADPSLVNLVVTDPANPNGVDVPPGDGGNGWSLSAGGETATLEGAVCATAKAGGYTSIQFVYGCPTFN